MTLREMPEEGQMRRKCICGGEELEYFKKSKGKYMKSGEEMRDDSMFSSDVVDETLNKNTDSKTSKAFYASN